MIVLDTDYLTLLEQKDSLIAEYIYQELSQRKVTHTTTIINYEEQMRGWMDYIAKAKTFAKQRSKDISTLRRRFTFFAVCSCCPLIKQQHSNSRSSGARKSELGRWT